MGAIKKPFFTGEIILPRKRVKVNYFFGKNGVLLHIFWCRRMILLPGAYAAARGDRMRKKVRWVYALWIGACLAVGALSGLLSRNGMERYVLTAVKPSFAPPPWIFPIVWTLLFMCMGIGAATVQTASQGAAARKGLNWMVAQLALNFFWPLLFFNASAYGLSFCWLVLLWGAVLRMTLSFRAVSPAAAILQVPYLLWLSFAACLNAAVWYLNA